VQSTADLVADYCEGSWLFKVNDVPRPVTSSQDSAASRIYCQYGKIVILTGTVFPQSTENLSRVDSEKRRQDYEDALTWWKRSCQRLGLDLISAENSDPTLLDWVPDGVQSLYLPSVHESEFGKGRGEFDLISSAVDVLSDQGVDFQWIAKCTGRLIVRNLEKIIPPVNSEDFVVGRMSRDLTSLDSRFVIGSKNAWSQTLLVSKDKLDDSAGQYLEQLWARNLLNSIPSGTAFLPFKRVPQFKGFSGTSDFKYHSFKRRIGAYFEDVANYATEVGKRI